MQSEVVSAAIEDGPIEENEDEQTEDDGQNDVDDDINLRNSLGDEELPVKMDDEDDEEAEGGEESSPPSSSQGPQVLHVEGPISDLVGLFVNRSIAERRTRRGAERPARFRD